VAGPITQILLYNSLDSVDRPRLSAVPSMNAAEAGGTT